MGQSQGNIYWWCQLGGWGLYFLINAFVGITLAGFQLWVVLLFLIVSLSGLLVIHLFRIYIHKADWKNQQIGPLIIKSLVSSVGLSVIWMAISFPTIYGMLYWLSIDFENVFDWPYMLLTLINYSILYLMWFLIYFGYHLFEKYRRAEIDKWKLEAAVKDAELLALKAQINPHFIFNSLNNIRGLVLENPEKAQDMITNLSGLLRYSLQFSTKETVTLEEELRVVRGYLNLESIQLEDRLKFEIEIEKDTLLLKIPPMAIQLLVENAIKHGISQLRRGGFIKIAAFMDMDNLVVEVFNTGQLPETSSGKGIGLKNASERLRLVFGKLTDLKIENIDKTRVRARFSINQFSLPTKKAPMPFFQS